MCRVNPSVILKIALAVSAGTSLVPRAARADLIFETNYANGTVGEYTTSGATVNASLVTGLQGSFGVVTDGSNLYVANFSAGRIGKYTMSGATVNASLITGLNGPLGLAISGSNLFVSNPNNGTIGKYTTSGATVNAALVTGLSFPEGIDVSGNNLFVTNRNSGTVGEYSTINGSAVNASLITGLPVSGQFGLVDLKVSGSNLFVTNNASKTIAKYDTTGDTLAAPLIQFVGGNLPTGIAVSGTDLYETNNDAGTIGHYSAIDGSVVNASLITGLSAQPRGIIVVPVPEPVTGSLLGIGGVTLLSFRPRRRDVVTARHCLRSL